MHHISHDSFSHISYRNPDVGLLSCCVFSEFTVPGPTAPVQDEFTDQSVAFVQTFSEQEIWTDNEMAETCTCSQNCFVI